MSMENFGNSIRIEWQCKYCEFDLLGFNSNNIYIPPRWLVHTDCYISTELLIKLLRIFNECDRSLNGRNNNVNGRT